MKSDWVSCSEVISMDKKHNVAIVGCGIISQTHLRALKGIDNLKVVAVCDTDKSKATAVSKQWKIDHYYTDLSKMLSDETISILSILTPPSSHAPIAVEAIKQGINVLIEKPLTMTTKEADPIISALRGSSAKMTVVYHFLFSRAMLEALSLIRAQVTGEVLSADMKMINDPRMDPMTSDPNHWSHKLFGGRLGEMLPHPVYVLQSILGNQLDTKKVFVSKRGSIPWIPHDELHVILESEKGLGSLYVSLNAPRFAYTCDVFCTKRILKIDMTRQMLLQQGPMGVSNLSIAKDCLSDARRLSLLTTRNALQYSFRKHGAYAVSHVYSMFADSIRNNSESLVTPEMAYNTVKIVEEICTNIEQTRALDK
jgi:predicted dehydrogenase